jgi:cyclopropane-fatty-acyl-phospholipid synthase
MKLDPLRLAETGLVPDSLIRIGIRSLLAKTLHRERQVAADVSAGKRPAATELLAQAELAINTDRANEQHYELPAVFFEAVLGPRLKYSSGLWPSPGTSFADSELAALRETCEHAQLADGQHILELGCGWGSLTLWMAETYPQSKILAVSNSHSQRAFILERCRQRGLTHVDVVTCDINRFEAPRQFDRIVSVEMFEHVRNHRQLLERVSRWLEPDGRLFAHVFAHRDYTYTFEEAKQDDWIAHHFFSGGVMPGVSLLPYQGRDVLEVEAQWLWKGTHYQRTSEAWLERFDAAWPRLQSVFASTYGAQATLWRQRWRIFFMACAELFGYEGGEQWLVAHYRMRAKRPTSGS